MCVARDISWRDHHRKPERKKSVAEQEFALVLNSNTNGAPGRNSRDGSCKNVGPLLLKQRGFFALGLGFFVYLFGFASLLDLTDNQAIPDSHFQGIDRGILGQRKHIHPLQPKIGRVMKILRHDRPGDDAGNLDINLGSQHRHWP